MKVLLTLSLLLKASQIFAASAICNISIIENNTSSRLVIMPIDDQYPSTEFEHANYELITKFVFQQSGDLKVTIFKYEQNDYNAQRVIFNKELPLADFNSVTVNTNFDGEKTLELSCKK